MKTLSEIESRRAGSKMKIANWKRRVVLASFGLCVLCLFAGCPEQALVTVTIKPVAGASEASAGGAAAVETAAAGYGSLVGTIKYEGTPKDLPPLVAAGDSTLKPEDKAVCAAVAVPNETLVINANGGLANAII